MTRCWVEFNGSEGIRLSGSSIISHNTVVNNGLIVASAGIRTQGSIIGNHVSGNKGNGINTVNAGSLVKNNLVTDNDGDGIHDLLSRSTIIGNQITSNGGLGLSLAAGSGYGNNVIDGNTSGTVSGGVELGANICGGSIICP